MMTTDQYTAAMNSLVEKQDELIMEAVSRTLGHTEWNGDTIVNRGKWVRYPDKSAVWSFDGRDMLLFEPPATLGNTMGQPVQYLYDKTDFKYMTEEERIDRGLVLPK